MISDPPGIGCRYGSNFVYDIPGFNPKMRGNDPVKGLNNFVLVVFNYIGVLVLKNLLNPAQRLSHLRRRCPEGRLI